MTTNPPTPDRLDRVERILESIAERQEDLQQQQERSQQQLDQLSEKQSAFQQQQERSQQQLDQLRQESQLHRAEVQTDLQRNIADVVSMIGSLTGDLDALNAQVNAFIAQSTAFLAAEQRDRAEFRQQVIGLQTEARNILRELADLRRQQQGNGGQ